MDAYMLWLGNAITQHLATHLQPAMPHNLWLLVHDVTIVIVKGDAPDAQSQGGVTLSMPETPNAELLEEYTSGVLDHLQDRIASLVHTGWPGTGGMLHARAEVRGPDLLLGYLPAGADWGDGSTGVVLPPFRLPTDEYRPVLAG